MCEAVGLERPTARPDADRSRPRRRTSRRGSGGRCASVRSAVCTRRRRPTTPRRARARRRREATTSPALERPRTNLTAVRLVGLRGAITCAEDTKEEIDAKTQRMVKELLARNEVEPDDIVSMIFTATEDLERRSSRRRRRAASASTRCRSSAPASSPSTARCPGASGSSCTATATGPATSCTTCTSKEARALRGDLPE